MRNITNNEAIRILERYIDNERSICRVKVPSCELHKCDLLIATGVAIDKLKEEKALDNLMRAAIDTNDRAQREKIIFLSEQLEKTCCFLSETVRENQELRKKIINEGASK